MTDCHIQTMKWLTNMFSPPVPLFLLFSLSLLSLAKLSMTSLSLLTIRTQGLPNGHPMGQRTVKSMPLATKPSMQALRSRIGTRSTVPLFNNACMTVFQVSVNKPSSKSNGQVSMLVAKNSKGQSCEGQCYRECALSWCPQSRRHCVCFHFPCSCRNKLQTSLQEGMSSSR